MVSLWRYLSPGLRLVNSNYNQKPKFNSILTHLILILNIKGNERRSLFTLEFSRKQVGLK